jgi:hypothetical protein
VGLQKSLFRIFDAAPTVQNPVRTIGLSLINLYSCWVVLNVIRRGNLWIEGQRVNDSLQLGFGSFSTPKPSLNKLSIMSSFIFKLFIASRRKIVWPSVKNDFIKRLNGAIWCTTLLGRIIFRWTRASLAAGQAFCWYEYT